MLRIHTELVQTFINDLRRIEGGLIYISDNVIDNQEFGNSNIFGACVLSNREKVYYICLIDFLHIKCISTERITSEYELSVSLFKMLLIQYHNTYSSIKIE